MNVLLIAGSRLDQPEDLEGRRQLVRALHHKLNNASYMFDVVFDKIIHGDARGIDRIGGAWAEGKGYEVEKYPADWDKLGKRAGYLRNIVMVENCTHAIVLWDGKSKGSKHTIDALIREGVPAVVSIITDIVGEDANESD